MSITVRRLSGFDDPSVGAERWNQLHRLVYAAAVAGCVHFLWAVKKDITEPLVYIAIFTLLFAMRFRVNMAAKKARTRRATASAA